MRTLIIGAWIAMTASSGALAQDNPPWTVAKETLGNGDTAIVLAREQPGGRAELRVLFDRRRVIGVFSEHCGSSFEFWAAADGETRRQDARDSFAGMIGADECRLGKDVLDGFDAGFAKLEAMVQSTPLPAVQAWAPGIAGYHVRREDDAFAISYDVADLTKKRLGVGMVAANREACRNEMKFFETNVKPVGDAAANAEAARAAVAGKLDEAIRTCGASPDQAARLMAGFVEAVTRQEARWAKDSAN